MALAAVLVPMDVRTFPVLTAEDEALVGRLSVGINRNAARVLAYLLRRLADPDLADTATRTAIHIGAGISKNAATDALNDLFAADLIAETTAPTAAPGRPPKAWHAAAPRTETVRRTYARHANRLIEQGERYAAVLESSSSETAQSDDSDRIEKTGGSDGFDPADSADGTSSSAESAALGQSNPRCVSVGLNWHSNVLHLPLFAARAADASDISIAFCEYDGSLAAANAVASGACDVGVVGAATVLRAREGGRSIVPIAVCFQRSTVVLYTTREAFEGPFETIERLRDRRVGIPAGTETGLLGRLLLEQAGIRKTVEVVDIDGEERAALRSGEVDAVTGMFPDPDRLESAGKTVDVVAVADVYPAYGPALITNKDILRQRRPLLEDFLAATMVGRANAVRKPTESAIELATESDDSPERIARTFERAVDRFGTGDAVRRRGWGWHSPDEWQNLRDALAQGEVVADD